MALTTIFPEQNIVGFAYDDRFGMHLAWPYEPMFVLTVGTEYTVMWDGEEHTLTAATMSMGGNTGVCVGNLSLLGLGDDTGEKFLFGFLDVDQSNIFFSTEEKESHTLAIYRAAKDEEPGNDAKTMIFEERSIGTFWNADYGVNESVVVTPLNPIETGKTYTVVWDGVDYTLTAYPYTMPYGDSVITLAALGCKEFVEWAMAGGVGDEPERTEPFNLAYGSIEALGQIDVIMVNCVHIDCQQTNHTLAIYKGAAETPQIGIVLRDYKGEETAHYGIERLEVDTTNGGTELYVREDLVATPVEHTVELDFSGGDMVVTPKDGQTFSAVNIPIPAGLIPEIIPEGQFIAGVGPGTLAASGGVVLPAGCYWEVLDIPLPTKYTQTWVRFNGDLYSFASSRYGNGWFQYIYKWENGSWSDPIAGGGLGSFPYPTNPSYIEYNGKLHIMGGDKSYHYTFDGASVKSLNSLPSTVVTAFVENGILKACRSNGTLYAWDESSDTWTLERTVTSGLYFYNCGDIILASKTNALYAYSGGTLTDLTAGIDLTFTNGTKFVHNGYFYTHVPNDFHGPDLYRYDPVSHTVELVGRIPMKCGSLIVFDYQGDLCILNTNSEEHYASISPWIMREIKANK